MITIDDFQKVDIRAGVILEASVNEHAKIPAYKLVIDFGDEIGVKTSSAQITDYYTPEELVGKFIVAVVNFPPRQVAKVMSEVLVLGTDSKGGIVLLSPDKEVAPGDVVC